MRFFTSASRRRPSSLHTVLASWILLGAAVPLQASAHGPPSQFLESIRSRISGLIAQHHGVVGLAVVDPVNGDSFSIMGDEEFPSASLVKLGVMVDAFARVREGSLSLNDPLTLLALDQTGGSGVLQFLSTPRELTIWDAVFLMVTLSDNTATNLLLEKLRPRQVTERMRSLGLEHTRIFLPVNANAGESFDPEASRAFGLGVTTPVEIAALLTMLYRGELVDAEASEKMLGIMTRQFYREGIPRELPPEVAVAHKTGSLDRARNDCGVVYGPSRDFVICVMTKENEDQTWTYDNEAERLIAAISREVYEALNPETGRVGDGVTRHPVPGSGYR